METSVKWYITRGQQRIGPLDASQLKHMAMTEQLAPTEYVWKEGMAQWIPAGQVQGLFDRPVEVALDVPVTGAENAAAAPPVAQTPVRTVTATQNSTPVSTQSATPAATAQYIPQQRTHTQTTALRPASTAGTLADTLIPILAGLLMLATIIVPWARVPEYTYGPIQTVYSWKIISNAFDGGQTSMGVWLIASWVVAALAIVFSLVMRGSGRALMHIILGLVALICMLIVVFKIGPGDDRFKTGASELETPLGFIASCVMVLMLIVAHAIRRGGMNGPLRLSTIIAAAALLIITITLLITAFAASNSLWSQYGGWRIKSPWKSWLRATLLIGHIGTILATLLILLHAIVNARGRLLVTLGLVILYPVMLFTLIMDSVNTAGAFNEWDKLWTMINGTALMLGTLIILGSGVVQLIAHSRRTA